MERLRAAGYDQAADAARGRRARLRPDLSRRRRSLSLSSASPPCSSFPIPPSIPSAVCARAVRDPLVRARLYRRAGASAGAIACALAQAAARSRARRSDDRRFPGLGDARRRARRPHRLCAVLQARLLLRRTRRDPRSSGMAACRSMAARSACCVALVLFCRQRGISLLGLRRHHRLRRADRPVLRPHRQFHQWRAVGPADRRALGDGLSQRPEPLPRHPSQLYEAALEGIVLFLVLCLPAALATASRERPGTLDRRVPHRLWRGAHHRRVLPRARRQSRLSLSAAHHGPAPVGAGAPRRRSGWSGTRASRSAAPA